MQSNESSNHYSSSRLFQSARKNQELDLGEFMNDIYSAALDQFESMVEEKKPSLKIQPSEIKS
jgi:hypothetical protein